MQPANKPAKQNEVHPTSSSDDDFQRSSDPSVIVESSSPSSNPNGVPTQQNNADQQKISSVDRLHRAWRQMVSSFLVAARSSSAHQDEEKLITDALETALRSRSELRRMLFLIEEDLTGRDGKQRELLEDDLYSLPTAFINKKRKLE
mmetsp:Transcript_6195/g.9052  ORF Transcript_6195/g.9052 Transcript_6195/m.9052 type:complete len:147 (+) Transcript_6195:50-490(+)|eukprot:CAMPEP_0172417146 /NCGR_PEP_ID=MMETSP1064-20121228/3657_1 /TAXON_ID=202472 /ORGANISM="Aulacoseira subarctica , Strain CCAP 1002/5" /LENGTH=146 /DNA_ID=CAMNT_0013155273 /DNA_START=47 /DNA_END=487 /DNA_ORIENTATION=-